MFLLVVVTALAGAGTFMLRQTVSADANGGPVVLMGIDAEDQIGTAGQHGPISVYVSVVNSLYTQATNGGTGVLVIGGGKSPTDDVTMFWNAIDADPGTTLPVTFVNGAAAISAVNFSAFRVIAVVSDTANTPSGGLTLDEHNALSARQAAVVSFINNGGGLFGLSSDFPNPYGYLAGVGSFIVGTGIPGPNGIGYDNVTATAEGNAVGISDTNLDICCWHDEYLTFPSFLKVLAINPTDGHAAAIGGARVLISSITLAPPTQTLTTGKMATVTATVQENGAPAANKVVTFTILPGSINAGVVTLGTATTNASGQASVSYTSSVGGTDTIQASYVDSFSNTQQSNTVTVIWQLDSDGDMVPDLNDNCPTTPNMDQADSDGDGRGNVCDNCPNTANGNQADSDGDGVGDACDNCPSTPNADQADSDGDGVGNVCDNCPTTANANQADADNDGVGDVCDNCPRTSNPDQADSNNDGVGDACTPAAAFGQFVIGDLSKHAAGQTVLFWGAQWAKNNPMSGGMGPNAFKGFEDGNGMPACGSTWTSKPGNSSDPPATIPADINVVVSSSITKKGNVITGNIVQILRVHVGPGYGPAPGHAGSGTVVSVVCTSQ